MSMLTMSYAKETAFEPIVPKDQALLPFQKAGVEYAIKAKRTLIADEMGLGKTPEAVATMNTAGVDKYLIFCPASLCDNWRREIGRWSCSSFEPVIYNNMKTTPRSCILICSYGLASQFETISHILKNYRFDGLILDECHYLSNPLSKRSSVLFGVNGAFDRAEYILALSGTPITNKPIDIYALANRLNPAALGVRSFEEFGDTFAHRFKNPYTHRTEYRGSRNEEELGHRLRSSMMIRRLKADVLKDLPAKWRRAIYLDPSPEAKDLVAKECALHDNFLAGQRLTQDEVNLSFRVRSQLAILKAPSVIEYCRLILETEEKIIVFGWHRDFLSLVLYGLAGYGCTVISGGTPKNLRIQRVDRFQNDPFCRVFVGAITAAGTGITLTKANYVVMGEASWVPGENVQAEDRAHRIGQKGNVQVDYTCFPNSVDERVLKMSGSKADSIRSILDSTSQCRDEKF